MSTARQGVVAYTRCLFGGMLLGALFIASAAEFVVTQQNAPEFYRGFKRMTEHPHWVSLRIAVLCTLPRREDVDREKKFTGVHYNTRVHIYANPAAAQIVTDGKSVFPEGAVLVKEKLDLQGKISGIGGMIKRAPGYDAANGDWEYFFYGGAEAFAAGRIQSCIECHRAAQARDYTHRAWYVPRK